MRTLYARSVVGRETLVGDDILVKVTTGARGEIVALAANQDPYRPGPSQAFFRYTVTSWREGTARTLYLDNLDLRIGQVQPMDPESFLLVSPVRWGSTNPNNAILARLDGVVLDRFPLSYWIRDMQIDPIGHLWFSYFDEGFDKGRGLSREGLVQLDHDRQVTFRFNQRARETSQPLMYDCSALNVATERDVFAYYYAATQEEYFPLVHVHDNDIAHVWRITQV